MTGPPEAVHGTPAGAETGDAPALDVNRLSDEAAHAALLACFGSPVWVQAVLSTRPHPDLPALLEAAGKAWQGLDAAGWHEAFRAMPERAVPPSDEGTRRATELALRLYRERFGWPFIAEQEDLPGDELLIRIRIRLGHEPAAEFRKTCAELTTIGRRRLNRLIP
ncbi:MAG TPA: 2-oxo-4-hydroxy-4-carboxy-5-ureidoimidazoline decarboxylase [Longimicrobiales bacterium]|nr:2-oxo-4-hydroxy-4-carboxy-5-ureidoimidazoline decarboxylase [Longimicrobiales bacterium]